MQPLCCWPITNDDDDTGAHGKSTRFWTTQEKFVFVYANRCTHTHTKTNTNKKTRTYTLKRTASLIQKDFRLDGCFET